MSKLWRLLDAASCSSCRSSCSRRSWCSACCNWCRAIPALALAGDYASAQRIAEIRHEYGFDQPMVVQYGMWLWHALHGDLGLSLFRANR